MLAIVWKKGSQVNCESKNEKKPDIGSPEQFYAEVIIQPSLAIERFRYTEAVSGRTQSDSLEYLYSLSLTAYWQTHKSIT